MCAILDANAAHQIFGSGRRPAGEEFLDWIECREGKLVVGGKQRHEFYRAGYGEWLREAIIAGKIKEINAKEVKEEKKNIRNLCRSDDHHMIALARLGGARLLYSNDRDLHQDFKNKNLIDKPRGKIYPYSESGELTDTHRTLLRENVCRD